MRVPQVSERIKEAPAQALRGVFAGIGQLLLVSDKLRHKTPAGAGVPRTRAPEAADPGAAPAAEPAAADSAPAPAADSAPAPAADSTPAADVKPEAVKPGVVVVEQPAAAAAVAAEPVVVADAPGVVAAEAVVAGPAAARATARKSPNKPPARDFDKTGNVRLLAGEEDAEAAASDVPAVSAEITPPPLPNYDELSIASLRARLRNLDVPQLKQVADYERSHAGRAEVIAMFERRVAKLEAEPEAGA
jgi:hypothetical protein